MDRGHPKDEFVVLKVGAGKNARALQVNILYSTFPSKMNTNSGHQIYHFTTIPTLNFIFWGIGKCSTPAGAPTVPRCNRSGRHRRSVKHSVCLLEL